MASNMGIEWAENDFISMGKIFVSYNKAKDNVEFTYEFKTESEILGAIKNIKWCINHINSYRSISENSWKKII